MSSRKLWGEMEEEPIDEDLLQNVNFNPIIELGMQNIPEISVIGQSAPAVFPQQNLITHTVQLHAYSRQLTALLIQAKKKRNFRLNANNIPMAPPEPFLRIEHEAPHAYLERTFSSFALGQGPVVLPFTAESHNRALRQCAAIAIAHVGIEWCTSTALTATADALDSYITKFCQLMRTIADRDTRGLEAGFNDIVSKVLHEAQVGNLEEFYENRVIRYHAKIKKECDDLKAKCYAIAAKNPGPPPKVNKVPQLHFPANMEETFSPSLEPGFQMLQTLEQGQLQDVELMDVASSSIKVENIDFTQSAITPKPSTSSTGAKKKKK